MTVLGNWDISFELAVVDSELNDKAEDEVVCLLKSCKLATKKYLIMQSLKYQIGINFSKIIIEPFKTCGLLKI